MQTTVGGEKKARLLDERAAQRFGVAVRLTIEGPDGHSNSPVYGHLKLPHLN